MAVARKTDGWVRVETGESGNVFVFVGQASAEASALPSQDVGTGSVALRQDGKKFLFHEDTGWVEFAG